MTKFDFSTLTPKQQHQTMVKHLLHEQVLLWEDLAEEIDAATNGWSIGCEATVDRILDNAMLVGAAPWEKVRWKMVASRIYRGVWTSAKLPNAAPQKVSPTIKVLLETESKMTHYGQYKSLSVDSLTSAYNETRIAAKQYVAEKAENGDFDWEPSPEPECTCAMTEMSFFSCEVHGEKAKVKEKTEQKAEQIMKKAGIEIQDPVAEMKKAEEVLKCTCASPVAWECKIHGPKTMKAPDALKCTCHNPALTHCQIHGPKQYSWSTKYPF
jgi:hypothetical protein